MSKKISGVFTALTTPFKAEPGLEINYKIFLEHLDFQQHHVAGVVPTGTTGEDATISHEDHVGIIGATTKAVGDRVYVLAGCGSNSLDEAKHLAINANALRAHGMLLVDPYKNRPSSRQCVAGYYGPLAKNFPDMQIVPYTIPTRTGTQLKIADFLRLAEEYENVVGIKEASPAEDTPQLEGAIGRMHALRAERPDIAIMAGNDDYTLHFIQDPHIKGDGVIAVLSNIFPHAMSTMVLLAQQGHTDRAATMYTEMEPLIKLEAFSHEEVVQMRSGAKFRRKETYANPTMIKLLQNILGMYAGPMRAPLVGVPEDGARQVRDAARALYDKNYDGYFREIDARFGVDTGERLKDDNVLKAAVKIMSHDFNDEGVKKLIVRKIA